MTRVVVQALGFSRPLAYTKTLTLKDEALSIRYRIENRGTTGVSYLHACHPLLAVAEEDLIMLPGSTKTLGLHCSDEPLLGRAGEIVSWRHHRGKDLSRVGAEDSGVAVMLYTERVQEGWCGLYRRASGEGIAVRLDPEELPFLGLWLCYGGWPPDGAGTRQYAVAPEPTTAPFGTLAEAQRRGAARLLALKEAAQ